MKKCIQIVHAQLNFLCDLILSRVQPAKCPRPRQSCCQQNQRHLKRRLPKLIRCGTLTSSHLKNSATTGLVRNPFIMCHGIWVHFSHFFSLPHQTTNLGWPCPQMHPAIYSQHKKNVAQNMIAKHSTGILRFTHQRRNVFVQGRCSLSAIHFLSTEEIHFPQHFRLVRRSSLQSDFPYWMKFRSDQYLFITEEACCNVHECEPKYWYPNILHTEGGRSCLYDGNYPSWMTYESNKSTFLFDNKEACCAKHGCEGMN